MSLSAAKGMPVAALAHQYLLEQATLCVCGKGLQSTSTLLPTSCGAPAVNRPSAAQGTPHVVALARQYLLEQATLVGRGTVAVQAWEVSEGRQGPSAAQETSHVAVLARQYLLEQVTLVVRDAVAVQAGEAAEDRDAQNQDEVTRLANQLAETRQKVEQLESDLEDSYENIAELAARGEIAHAKVKETQQRKEELENDFSDPPSISVEVEESMERESTGPGLEQIWSIDTLASSLSSTAYELEIFTIEDCASSLDATVQELDSRALDDYAASMHSLVQELEGLAIHDALESVHVVVQELEVAQSEEFRKDNITLDVVACSVQNTISQLDALQTPEENPPSHVGKQVSEITLDTEEPGTMIKNDEDEEDEYEKDDDFEEDDETNEDDEFENENEDTVVSAQESCSSNDFSLYSLQHDDMKENLQPVSLATGKHRGSTPNLFMSPHVDHAPDEEGFAVEQKGVQEENFVQTQQNLQELELKLKQSCMDEKPADVEAWLLEQLLAASKSSPEFADSRRESLQKKRDVQEKQLENRFLKDLNGVYENLVQALKTELPSDPEAFSVDHLCKVSQRTIGEEASWKEKLARKREVQQLQQEQEALKGEYQEKLQSLARRLMAEKFPEKQSLLEKNHKVEQLRKENAELKAKLDKKFQDLKRQQNWTLDNLVNPIHSAVHELEGLGLKAVEPALQVEGKPEPLDEELLVKRGIRISGKLAIVKVYGYTNKEGMRRPRLKVVAFLPKKALQLALVDSLHPQETPEQACQRILGRLTVRGILGHEQLLLSATTPVVPKHKTVRGASYGVVQRYLESQAHAVMLEGRTKAVLKRARAEEAEKEKRRQLLGVAQSYLTTQLMANSQQEVFEEVDRLGRTIEIQTNTLFTPRGENTLLGPLITPREAKVCNPRFRVLDSLMGGLRLEEPNPPPPRKLPPKAADSVFGLLGELDPLGSPRSKGESHRPVTAPGLSDGLMEEDRRHRTRAWLKDVAVARRIEHKNTTLLIQKKHRDEIHQLQEENKAHSNQVLAYLFTHENSQNLVNEVLTTGALKATSNCIVNDPYDVISGHLIQQISDIKATETIQNASDRAVAQLLEQRAAAMIVGSSLLKSAVAKGMGDLLTVQISAEKKALVAKRHAQSYLSSVVGKFVEVHREELQVKDHLTLCDARAYLQRQALSVAAALHERRSKVNQLARTYLSCSVNDAILHSRKQRLKQQEQWVEQESRKLALSEVCQTLVHELLAEPPVTQPMVDRFQLARANKNTASNRRCRQYSSNTEFVPGWPLVDEDDLEEDPLMTMYPWEHPDNQEFAKGEWTAFEDEIPEPLPSKSFLVDSIPEGITVDHSSTHLSVSSNGGPSTHGSVQYSESRGDSREAFRLEEDGKSMPRSNNNISQSTDNSPTENRRLHLGKKKSKDSKDMSGGVYISPRISEALRQAGRPQQSENPEDSPASRTTVTLPEDTLGRMVNFDVTSPIFGNSKQVARDRVRTNDSDLVGLQFAQTDTPSKMMGEDYMQYTGSQDLAPLTPPGGHVRQIQHFVTDSRRESQSMSCLPTVMEGALGTLEESKSLEARTFLQRNAELQAMTNRELEERRRAKEVFVKTLPTVNAASKNSSKLRQSSLAAFRKKGYGGASSKYIQYWEAKLQRSRAYYDSKAALSKAVGTIVKARGPAVTREAAFCALAEADGIVGEAFSHLLNSDFLKEMEVVCKIIDVSKYMSFADYQNFMDTATRESSLPQLKKSKKSKTGGFSKGRIAQQMSPETRNHRRKKLGAHDSSTILLEHSSEVSFPHIKSKSSHHSKKKKLASAYQVDLGLEELKQQIKASKRLANPKYKGAKKNSIEQMIEDQMYSRSVVGR